MRRALREDPSAPSPDTQTAVVTLLVEDPPATALAGRIAGQALHAPHLIDVEFLHVLRRLVATGRVSEARAPVIRGDFAGLHLVRYPHTLLLDRMWELRHNLSAYDGAFVALSEALEVPLVTTDTRVATAPGHHATVEAYRTTPVIPGRLTPRRPPPSAGTRPRVPGGRRRPRPEPRRGAC